MLMFFLVFIEVQLIYDVVLVSGLAQSDAVVYTAAAKLHESCLTLCDPIDGIPPGSYVHGILQARALEWIALSLSAICMYICICSFSYSFPLWFESSSKIFLQ